MRVVDSLLFALTFFVDSIVCQPPPFPEPHPPYRVVRMQASYLQNLYVPCEVNRPGSREGNYEYCEVQGSLDVIKKDDTVIGYVNHRDEIAPIFDRLGITFQKLKMGGLPEKVYSGEAGRLGIYSKVPENTIFEPPVVRGAPPPHRMILHKDREGNVLFTELLPWRPWRIALMQSPNGRWEYQPH